MSQQQTQEDPGIQEPPSSPRARSARGAPTPHWPGAVCHVGASTVRDAGRPAALWPREETVAEGTRGQPCQQDPEETGLRERLP